MARLIIPTDVGTMTRPIIPTNHVGAMARRTKGRFLDVPIIQIVGITGLSEKWDVGIKDVS